MLGYICDAGYISDGGYMGSAPCPQVRRWRYSGGCPNPTKDASYLGSQPQAPNISDGVYLGECPSPRVFMGSAPCPQVQTLPLFVEPEPNERTQAIWGAYPKPPISPMACIWELPKPQGVYGECPMPPRQDAAAIRGAEPNFSFFNFNSIPHDAKHQLGRHGVLQTTY